MWFCDSCGHKNEESARFCVECGKPRPVMVSPPPQQPQPAPQPVRQPAQQPRKRKLWWVWLLAGLATLITVLVVGYFTVHSWSAATCTQPETCRICGATRGVALGHKGNPPTCTEESVCIHCGRPLEPALGHTGSAATCTEPSVCTRCGKILSPALGHVAGEPTCTKPAICSRCGEEVAHALGHDWSPATYDSPETCRRCGLTQGEVKGYLGSLDGYLSSEKVGLFGYNTRPYVLYTPVKNCMRLTVSLELTDVSGDPYGKWALYIRQLDGKWKAVANFEVDESALNNEVLYLLEFNSYPSFDAVCILPVTGKNYNFSFMFDYIDAQVYEG